MESAQFSLLTLPFLAFLSCTPIDFPRDRGALAPSIASSPPAESDESPPEYVEEYLEQPLESAAFPDVPYSDAVAPIELSMPAEFENRAAILLDGLELPDFWPELFAQLVRAIRERVTVVVLVRDDENRAHLEEILAEHGLPPNAATFIELDHDTLWIRDFGPRLARDAHGQVTLIDSRYGDEGRPLDDDVPQRLAAILEIPVLDAPFELDGGNLLSNGEGLCLTTTALLETQKDESGELELRVALRRYYGCREVVFLEALVGEDTGHVDMFATFTAPDTVVIGRYDPEHDSVNSDLLDRNARRLSYVRTSSGPLRVERIPMPPNTDGTWRSYTNVVYAGGRLILPTYLETDLDGWLEARRVYRRLLPEWEIVGIDSESLASRGGALHCATLDFPCMPPRLVRAGDFRMQKADVGQPFLLEPNPVEPLVAPSEEFREDIGDHAQQNPRQRL